MNVQYNAKNITQMTEQDHGFEGFNIRVQRKGYSIRKYVSAAPIHHGRKSLNIRRELAFQEACKLLAAVREILSDTKSWHKGVLTKAAHNRLAGCKMKVERI